ncbi:trehalose-6-phosphate synthase [Salmonella sp. NCTC 11881]|nr:trehalose-6-phosphate synthase [Salmonella sp. NCTC 11881]
MSRLVVVSNRIAPPDNKGGAGGLAVGVLGALKAAGGLWFGWSGETGNEDEPLKKVTKGNITWASFKPERTRLRRLLLSIFQCGSLACVPLSSGPGTVSASCMGRLYAGECVISG